jgi:hypothetical protein
MTQKTDLLDHLNAEGKITRAEAFNELGIAELSARVIDLEADGYIVPRKTVEVTARNGRKCRVTQYRRPYRATPLPTGKLF